MKKKELVGWVHSDWKEQFDFLSMTIMLFPLIRKHKNEWFTNKVKITIEDKKVTIDEE